MQECGVCSSQWICVCVCASPFIRAVLVCVFILSRHQMNPEASGLRRQLTIIRFVCSDGEVQAQDARGLV